jgi:hypothetical protein
VVAFFAKAAADTKKSLPFNVILDLSFDGSRTSGPPARGQESAADRVAVAELPPVTLSAKDVSLYDALEAVCDLLHLRCVLRDTCVLLVPCDAPPGPLVTRYYSVLPSVGERIVLRDCERNVGQTAGHEREADWRAFFAQMGVQWPRGSFVRYIRSIGSLVVANTVENLDLFEKVLAGLNVVPTQIDIEVEFLECERADVSTLLDSGRLNDESLRDLRRRGRATVLSVPRVVTQPGVPATLKGVREYIYPAEFSVLSRCGTNAVTETTATGTVVQPCGFETREVGTILEVTPDMSPETQLITLNLSPRFVFEPAWKDYGGPLIVAGARPQRVRMEQPLFRTSEVATSVTVRHGETVMIGGGVPGHDEDHLVFMFATARLVGVDGKPIMALKPGEDIGFAAP